MKNLLKKVLLNLGYEIHKTKVADGCYNQDGLKTYLNHDFVKEPKFVKAYNAGKKSGPMYPGPWRFHTALWAAKKCSVIDGDFVECGVNNGSLITAILNYLDWNELGKSMHLFDTWEGLNDLQVTPEEKKLAAGKWDKLYNATAFDLVKRNTAGFTNIFLYKGSVPNTLLGCAIDRVCYLSIDMNCMEPEIAAIEYFWPKISKGGVVLLDDYGWNGPHLVQKKAMDQFAKEKNLEILSLPTGQGLLIKQ